MLSYSQHLILLLYIARVLLKKKVKCVLVPSFSAKLVESLEKHQGQALHLQHPYKKELVLHLAPVTWNTKKTASCLFRVAASFVAWIRSAPKFKLDVYTSNTAHETNIYIGCFSPLVRNYQGKLVTRVHSWKRLWFLTETRNFTGKTNELKDSFLLFVSKRQFPLLRKVTRPCINLPELFAVAYKLVEAQISQACCK